MNFVKSSIFNFISSSLLYVINVATSILQARVLGPTELGRYQLLISTQTILVATLSFGLGQAGIYFRNNKKISLERIVPTLLKAEFLIFFLGVLSLFIIIFYNKGYFGYIPFYAVVLYAIGGGSVLLGTSLRPLLVADMQVVKLQKTQFVTSISAFLALVFIYIFSGYLSVNLLIVLTSITSLLGSLLLLSYFINYFNIKEKIDWFLLKSMTFLGIRLSCNNIAFLFLQNAPVYLLSWMAVTKLADVGLYSRAIAICGIASFLNSTIGPLLYSKLSSVSDSQKINYSKIIASALLVVNVGMTILVFVFSKLLILILYGEEYVGADDVLKILSLTLVVTGTNELINGLLSSIGKPEYLLKNFILTLMVLIPLLYFFINLFGLTGCALAVLISTYVKTIFLIHSIKQFFDFRYWDFFIVTRTSLLKLQSLITTNIKINRTK